MSLTLVFNSEPKGLKVSTYFTVETFSAHIVTDILKNNLQVSELPANYLQFQLPLLMEHPILLHFPSNL